MAAVPFFLPVPGPVALPVTAGAVREVIFLDRHLRVRDCGLPLAASPHGSRNPPLTDTAGVGSRGDPLSSPLV
jgi:hypothetical protein